LLEVAVEAFGALFVFLVIFGCSTVGAGSMLFCLRARRLARKALFFLPIVRMGEKIAKM
jgi:hypothetical protein